MNGALLIHPKVAGASLSGAVSLILLYVLARCGVTVTPEVAAAVSVVLSFVGGYLAPTVKSAG